MNTERDPIKIKKATIALIDQLLAEYWPQYFADFATLNLIKQDIYHKITTEQYKKNPHKYVSDVKRLRGGSSIDVVAIKVPDDISFDILRKIL